MSLDSFPNPLIRLYIDITYFINFQHFSYYHSQFSKYWSQFKFIRKSIIKYDSVHIFSNSSIWLYISQINTDNLHV